MRRRAPFLGLAALMGIAAELVRSLPIGSPEPHPRMRQSSMQSNRAWRSRYVPHVGAKQKARAA